jgi:hypothetical protein
MPGIVEGRLEEVNPKPMGGTIESRPHLMADRDCVPWPFP